MMPPLTGRITFVDGRVHGPADVTDFRVLLTSTRRRLFLTDTSYMGLVHRTSEVGDKIFLLVGGEKPFALRHQRGNEYLFWGDCYVHGIMDGEGLIAARAKLEPDLDLNDKVMA
jgi:hypothetical protein